MGEAEGDEGCDGEVYAYDFSYDILSACGLPYSQADKVVAEEATQDLLPERGTRLCLGSVNRPGCRSPVVKQVGLVHQPVRSTWLALHVCLYLNVPICRCEQLVYDGQAVGSPDHKEGASQVPKEAEKPVLGDLQQVCTPFIKGCRQVCSIRGPQLSCNSSQYQAQMRNAARLILEDDGERALYAVALQD